MKTRFKIQYLAVDALNAIPSMINDICGNSDRSKSILQKMSFRFSPLYMYRMLNILDRLGMWNDRVYWYRESFGSDIAFDVLEMVYGYLEQDDVVKVKSQEEMYRLLKEKKVICDGQQNQRPEIQTEVESGS